MRTRRQLAAALAGVGAIVVLMVISSVADLSVQNRVFAGPSASPTPTPAAGPAFDQAAALAKLREQIKGREKEPSTSVFKNLQTPFLKTSPAGRVLAVMEVAYSRSLGVTCTHCHVPDKWEVDDKPQKQVARDMAAMMFRINGELLPAIKNLKSERPTVNCTTCHRGDTKPALNLATPAKTQ